MNRAAIRIACCNMYPTVQTGLLDLFHEAGDIEVVASSPCGTDQLSRLKAIDPDLLIIGHRFTDPRAFDLVQLFQQAPLRARLILLSSDLPEAEVLTALRSGVRGLLALEMPAAEILRCVRQVHAGRTWIAPHIMRRTLEQLLREDAATAIIGAALTPQELVVMQLVVQGYPNKQVAAELGIAIGTVKTHLHNIYRKLGVENRVALVLHTHRNRQSDAATTSD